MTTAAKIGGDIIVIFDQGRHMGLMATQAILVCHSRTVGLMTGKTFLVSCMFGVALSASKFGVKARVTLHLFALLVVAGETDRIDCGAAISDIDLQGVMGIMAGNAFFYLVMGLGFGIMALGTEWNGVAPRRRVLQMTIKAGYRRQVLGAVGFNITHLLFMTFDTIAVQNFVVGLRCIRNTDPAKY